METSFFNSSFYYNSCAFNQALKQLNVEKTTFPEMEYIYNNDMFWRNLWKSIDDAKVNSYSFVYFTILHRTMFGYKLLFMTILFQHLRHYKN